MLYKFCIDICLDEVTVCNKSYANFNFYAKIYITIRCGILKTNKEGTKFKFCKLKISSVLVNEFEKCGRKSI